jgi:hypothetical protein
MINFERDATDQRPEIFRELARALRELAAAAGHTRAREELELLALRYQRLAEFREELLLLHSLPRYGSCQWTEGHRRSAA